MENLSTHEKTMENFKANLLRLANSDPNKPLTPSQIALLEKKLLLAFPTFKKPTHPTYAVMIESAINNLNEGNGSTEESISKYIKERFEGLPWAHDTYLSHHLNKLVEDGEIVLDNATKCYTTHARAVLQDSKSTGKRPTRVYFTFNGERKECGVKKGKEKVLVEGSEIPIGVQEGGNLICEKSKVKRRGRRSSKVDAKAVEERDKVELGVKDGDDLIKDGNEQNIGNAIVCDKECEVEVKFERENDHNDDTSPCELTILPLESVDKSSSTLSAGGDDCVPFEGSNRMSLSGEMSENGEGIFPMIVCGLEDVSKQKQLVYSRKKAKGSKEMKKVSSGSTPRRSKVSQVNKKVSPMSKPSSSALAVSHNELAGGPENKDLVEVPREPILMEEEENLPLQKVFEKYNKQKQNTLQNAIENFPLAIETTSDSVSKLQLDPENSEIPYLLLSERQNSPQKEASLVPDGQIDKTKSELETYVGPSNNMQIEVLENEQNQTSIGSPMLEQSLENYEHKKEDQESDLKLENLEAPIFVEEIRSARGQSCGELKVKLRQSLRKKLERSKDNLLDVPSKKVENLEAPEKDEDFSNSLLKAQEESFELETVTNSREKVKLRVKNGRGRPRKLLESSPDQRSKVLKTRGRGRPRKVIEVAKEDISSSSKLDIGVQAGSKTGPISTVKGRKNKKENRGTPAKKFEDPGTSNDDVPTQEKERKVEVREQSEIEVQMPNLSDEFHVSEPEKSKSEVLETCETQLGMPLSNDDCKKHEINQGDFEGKVGLPEMDGPGSPQKEIEENLEIEAPNSNPSDEYCVTALEESKSGDLSVCETKVVPFVDDKQVNEEKEEVNNQSHELMLSKEVFESGDGLVENNRRGRSRKIKKESDKERVSDQEKELEGDVCKQSEIEVEDLNGKQHAKEQEELQHTPESKIKQGKCEGQAKLSKTKSPKVTVSSNYPLRSRMNH